MLLDTVLFPFGRFSKPLEEALPGSYLHVSGVRSVSWSCQSSGTNHFAGLCLSLNLGSLFFSLSSHFAFVFGGSIWPSGEHWQRCLRSAMYSAGVVFLLEGRAIGFQIRHEMRTVVFMELVFYNFLRSPWILACRVLRTIDGLEIKTKISGLRNRRAQQYSGSDGMQV